MTDERMIRLLEEIRDLQRQHAERYGEALRDQGVHPTAAGGTSPGPRRARVRHDRGLLAVTMLVLILLRVVARIG